MSNDKDWLVEFDRLNKNITQYTNDLEVLESDFKKVADKVCKEYDSECYRVDVIGNALTVSVKKLDSDIVERLVYILGRKCEILANPYRMVWRFPV